MVVTLKDRCELTVSAWGRRSYVGHPGPVPEAFSTLDPAFETRSGVQQPQDRRQEQCFCSRTPVAGDFEQKHRLRSLSVMSATKFCHQAATLSLTARSSAAYRAVMDRHLTPRGQDRRQQLMEFA